ncbi:TRIO and F-actin-binding protein-like [Pectinophora gossypiella]|uniref:TRIO and F-actin-binding protein-like n=1 Tax=Pectinophora gossypiella TaxID=13191 RepID=UPI00214E37A9|nr:TRIO and F-actin-binding protein-like [Pectinophora gossypiella]
MSRDEPRRAEPSRDEPRRAETSRDEPSRAEPSRAEPSRAGSAAGERAGSAAGERRRFTRRHNERHSQRRRGEGQEVRRSSAAKGIERSLAATRCVCRDTSELNSYVNTFGTATTKNTFHSSKRGPNGSNLVDNWRRACWSSSRRRTPRQPAGPWAE